MKGLGTIGCPKGLLGYSSSDPMALGLGGSVLPCDVHELAMNTEFSDNSVLLLFALSMGNRKERIYPQLVTHFPLLREEASWARL
ncbi:unnamed protein product [Protopolystoma xenopodis]|uniref:Uncharacterized protein n=1 Tax=Protopolystoma xenopodis TaxID=117903 RepID=A0A3S5BA57_9PLAT|nr:unnamed protein product [Protopolystoma xenopodis]